MKVSYDRSADAAYVPLGACEPGEAVEQVVIERCGGDIVLDFDAAGVLLGVEIIGVSTLAPWADPK